MTFKLMTKEEQFLLAKAELSVMKSNVETMEAIQKANAIATRKLIRVDELTKEELLEMIYLYDEYDKEGHPYKIGDIFHDEGMLYEVIQSHTSLPNWKPSENKALYKNRTPTNVIPEWKQPTGGHDAYKIGDQVIYKGEIWESKIVANTTVPDADKPYNRYWKLI